MPKDLLDVMKPEYVTPIVAYLCSEQSSETGGLFEVGAGFFAKLRWQRTEGALFKLDDSFTPGAVAAKMEKISDFETNPFYPQSINDVDWMSLIESLTLFL